MKRKLVLLSPRLNNRDQVIENQKLKRIEIYVHALIKIDCYLLLLDFKQRIKRNK